MSRTASVTARKLARATLSQTATPAGRGYDPMAPLDEAGRHCFFCGEGRQTRLKVGKLKNLGYGTYCTGCGPDGERGRP